MEGLRQKGPRCKLHMHTFNLDSLRSLEAEPPWVDADEVQLVTSPNLHSLIVSYCSQRTTDHLDYHTRTLIHMVWQLAPNLEHVWMRHFVPSRFAVGPAAPDPCWDWFVDEGNIQPSRAKLRSLVFDGAEQGDDGIDFEHLAALTDFALLTSMEREIWTIPPPQALGELVYLVHDDQLPSLRALALHPYKDESAVLNDTALCHLLEGIECLESFAIVDYIGNEALQVLVTRHGPFLHRVVLESGRPHELPSSHGDMGYVGFFVQPVSQSDSP